MKRIFMICCVLAAVILLSCNKDNSIVVPLGKVTLTGIILPNASAMPGTNILLGRSTLKVDNLTNPQVGADIVIEGTIPLSSLRNAKIILKRGNDSISTVMYVDGQSTLSSNWIPVTPGTYAVEFRADIIVGTIGVIWSREKFQWEAEQSNGGYTAEFTGYKTMVSPYPTVPIITVNDLQQTLQDSGYIDYEFDVYNPHSTQRMFLPQFTFAININDVDNNDAIMSYKWQWFINDNDSSLRVSVTKNGIPTATFPEGITKSYTPYVSGNRQQIIDPLNSVRCKLRLFMSGLHNDGNNVSIQLLGADPIMSQGLYLNQVSPGINLRLTQNQGVGSSGTTVNMPWGLASGTPSASPGNSSKIYVAGGIPSADVIFYNQ